jgi:hypothetical protein
MTSRYLICIAVLTLFTAVSSAAAATWYVDGFQGNNHNSCKSRLRACKTISYAISLTSPGDSIIVAPAIYQENLTIGFSLKIIGSGAASTIVDGGRVSGVFTISTRKAHVEISGLTLRHGAGQGDGSGLYNCFSTVTIANSILTENSASKGNGNDGFGGAIYNCPGSTMTIIKTTISRNKAEVGGAICNGGTLTIKNSTFIGNTVRQKRAGAIANYGTLIISNSTFHGNSSSSVGRGGAILNGGLFQSPGMLTLSSSTLSENVAGDDKGGAIFNIKGSTAVLLNSIMANNPGGNCRGMLTSQGYNLSSDHSCDLHGLGDMNGTDPKLGRLRNNGGPTQTMALLQGSPAIDGGNPSGCADGRGHLLKTDQRGYPRPGRYKHDKRCDIGAYERQTD